MAFNPLTKLVPTDSLTKRRFRQVLGNHTHAFQVTHGTMDFGLKHKPNNTSLQRTIMAYPSSMLTWSHPDVFNPWVDRFHLNWTNRWITTRFSSKALSQSTILAINTRIVSRAKNMLASFENAAFHICSGFVKLVFKHKNMKQYQTSPHVSNKQVLTTTNQK